MSSDDLPQTQPAGELVPPPRKPPTAIAAATPLPPPSPSPTPGTRIVIHRTREIHLFPALVGFVASLFDAADVVADSIAEELGLRERNKQPSPPRS